MIMMIIIRIIQWIIISMNHHRTVIRRRRRISCAWHSLTPALRRKFYRASVVDRIRVVATTCTIDDGNVDANFNATYARNCSETCRSIESILKNVVAPWLCWCHNFNSNKKNLLFCFLVWIKFFDIGNLNYI